MNTYKKSPHFGHKFDLIEEGKLKACIKQVFHDSTNLSNQSSSFIINFRSHQARSWPTKDDTHKDVLDCVGWKYEDCLFGLYHNLADDSKLILSIPSQKRDSENSYERQKVVDAVDAFLDAGLDQNMPIQVNTTLRGFEKEHKLKKISELFPEFPDNQISFVTCGREFVEKTGKPKS